MLTTEKIRSALEPLRPESLTVDDISGNCGTSFRIEISSKDFVGARLIERQRMVHKALGEMMEEIHALELKCSLPTAGS